MDLRHQIPLFGGDDGLTVAAPRPGSFRERRSRRRQRRRGGWTGEMETGALGDSLARAVELNRRYAQSLGWQPYYDRMARVVGFTNLSPDEPTFARAVAVWQGRNGLTADGVVGPRTWARLQAALAGAPSSPAPSGAPAPVGTAGFLKDVPRLRSVPLPPSAPVAVDTRWPRERQTLARTYNRLGGLMQTLAGELGFEVAGVLAVWKVESGGRDHTVGRAVIRFENHLLWDRWGKSNPALFDQHFRYGGRSGVGGRRWEGHQFRESPGGAWETVHTGKQANEYRVLALAIRLAGDHVALQCISLGGPQILGSHYRDIGYASPREMYDAFQASERAHVLGFFDFCRTKPAPRRGDLIRYLREKNWSEFARYYNGPGQVATYGGLIGSNYQEAARLPLGGGGELWLETGPENEWGFGYEFEDDADASADGAGADDDSTGSDAADADAADAGGYADDGGDAPYDEPYREPSAGPSAPRSSAAQQPTPPASPPPAWSTSDGHVISLPSFTVRNIIQRILLGGRGRVRRDVASDPRRAVARRVGQIAKGARRVGTLRSRRTGRRYPVFGARSGGRSYRIVTRPRGARQNEIVLIQPVPGPSTPSF